MFSRLKSKTTQRLTRLVIMLLIIEFFDEWVFGMREAAWPLIRQELQLDYGQIGVLMSVPSLLAYIIETFIGVLGDTWKRRSLILGGGIVYAACLIAIAASHSFWPLLLAFIVINPASGAFVGLGQAALMDSAPDRHEQNMARWTFAGSMGVMAGTLTLGVCVAVGISWRAALLLQAAMFALLIMWGWRLHYPQIATVDEDGEEVGLWQGLKLAVKAVRRLDVLRWLVLLQFCNLMLDVLLGYLALYMVDVAGATEAQAALAVTVWAGVGLLGDFLLIFLLERVKGLTYLWYSVLIEMILFPLFLLVPVFEIKLVILALLGFFNAGWYSILQGQLYTSMPGQSGTVMSVGTVTGMLGSLIPLAIGLLADNFGLGVAIWTLMIGPLVLWFGVPWKATNATQKNENFTS
jgi:FSR family fosmidomycin resistance protein-like MFS transporter